MKILVLNGSPKKEKSDTLHLTKAFLQGMNEIQENDICMIHAIETNVKPCLGCLCCMTNGGNCVQKDGMQDILDKIVDSDLLVLSFPLYCYSLPAPLKVIIDRTMPLSSFKMHKVGDHYEHVSQKDFSKQKYLMISGCGFPNFKGNFEPMIEQFKYLFGTENSTIIAVPESPMFNAESANIVTKPFLKVVQQAGREYAQNGQIEPDTMEKINTPMISASVYEKIVNSK